MGYTCKDEESTCFFTEITAALFDCSSFGNLDELKECRIWLERKALCRRLGSDPGLIRFSFEAFQVIFAEDGRNVKYGRVRGFNS